MCLNKTKRLEGAEWPVKLWRRMDEVAARTLKGGVIKAPAGSDFCSLEDLDVDLALPLQFHSLFFSLCGTKSSLHVALLRVYLLPKVTVISEIRWELIELIFLSRYSLHYLHITNRISFMSVGRRSPTTEWKEMLWRGMEE